MTLLFPAVFLLALALALGLTPLTMRLARRYGFLDRPAARRVHHVLTPRLGGLPLYVAFMAAIFLSFLYPRTDGTEMSKLWGLVAGATVLLAMGALDDRRELPALPQFLAQAAAASFAIASGVLIDKVPNPLGGEAITLGPWMAVAFTLFWIVGMTNTINFLDGLDGLAAGVTAMAGAILLIHTWRQGQYSLTLPMLALLGAVLGFLYYNLPPARIFLGGGAHLLGLLLAVLSIIGGAKVASALLVLILPILDVAWQIVKRVRAGHSPFAADRGHLHHRLLDLGWSTRRIVLIYYAFSAAFGTLALLLPSGIPKLIALLLIGLGALSLLLWLPSASFREKS